jgi:uncharacterized RDD family membrane protein YckC
MKDRIFRRGMAFLLDLLLISLVFTLLYNFIPLEWLKGEYMVGSREFRWGIDLYGAVSAGYFLGSGLLMRGGSPGKDIMHLRTVKADGSALTRSLSLARTLLKLISIALLPLALIAYLWDGKETTLQDYLSGSRVERNRPVGIAR